MIHRVKGTQDFLDLTLWDFFNKQIAAQCSLYHYMPVQTPILENIELFKRGVGTETDVVSKEMFTIEPHGQSKDETICLRPEATASLVRAFIENSIEHTPWKVFTTGPMFRYERPQKGRYREFHSTSIEIIGAHSLSYDVELISMLDHFFHQKLKINNYALQINFLGSPEDRKKYKAVLFAFLQQHESEIDALCRERMHKNIMRVFDCKSATCQEIYKSAPQITDHLSEQSQKEWQELQNQLHLLSISFVHAPTLVRGLDYYTKTVFEFVSNNLGAQSTFCGGGRYDQLVTLLGGKEDQPSIGAGIGIERVLHLLEPIKDQLQLAQAPAITAILPLSEKQHTLALLIADELRAHSITCEIFFDGSIKSMMRKANKLAARSAILLGQEEQDSRTATVKNMITGQQEKIDQTALIAYLKK